MKAFTLGLIQLQFINCQTNTDKERNLQKAYELIACAYKELWKAKQGSETEIVEMNIGNLWAIN